jgi:multicomponent Na+:H+ antiporter subunit E
MRVLGRVVLLVALWLLAWGEITLANLLSGLAVAAALLVAFPPDRGATGHVRLRLRGVVRLSLYVCSQLVVSNIVMAGTILRRRSDLRPGVLAHRLEEPSEEVVAVMSSVIALSPGTMTVDVDTHSTSICVHFLQLRNLDVARASLVRLERLVVDAIGGRGHRAVRIPPPPKEAT